MRFMRMRNGEIEGIKQFLLNEELSGKYSRMRMRFIKLLEEHQSQLESERLLLIKQFANLDASENPIVINDGNESRYDMNDIEGFAREYEIMLNDPFVIMETEENEDMLKCIKYVILNTPRSFKGESAILYDRWCDIAEGVE